MTQDAETARANKIDEDPVNPDPRTVTVWSDIGCPWGTLALHTLRVEARDRGEGMTIDHRAFPLELFNRMPTPKSILDAEMVIIAGQRPELGWQLWNAADHTFPVTTLPALEAVQAAKDPAVGGLRASDQLDEALRTAFYVDSKCISVHSVVLDVAASCSFVDHEALATLMGRGSGRTEVYQQWQVAKGPEIQGSPHVFTVGGFARHNPGVVYRWTAPPPLFGGRGFPRLDSYRQEWAGELLDLLSGPTGPEQVV